MNPGSIPEADGTGRSSDGVGSGCVCISNQLSTKKKRNVGRLCAAYWELGPNEPSGGEKLKERWKRTNPWQYQCSQCLKREGRERDAGNEILGLTTVAICACPAVTNKCAQIVRYESDYPVASNVSSKRQTPGWCPKSMALGSFLYPGNCKWSVGYHQWFIYMLLCKNYISWLLNISLPVGLKQKMFHRSSRE